MTTLREAAQQALEALEETQQHRAYTQGIPDAITALRDALAQEEQEPVAWVWNPSKEAWEQVRAFGHWQQGAIYAFGSAPPRREWQGLTDREAKDTAYEVDANGGSVVEFARAIEAALKERNNG